MDLSQKVRVISLRLSLSQNLEVSVIANAGMESAQDQISLRPTLS